LSRFVIAGLNGGATWLPGGAFIGLSRFIECNFYNEETTSNIGCTNTLCKGWWSKRSKQSIIVTWVLYYPLTYPGKITYLQRLVKPLRHTFSQSITVYVIPITTLWYPQDIYALERIQHRIIKLVLTCFN